MTPYASKRRARLVIVVTLVSAYALPAVATGGEAKQFASSANAQNTSSKVYRMHRPGFRVRLEVRGRGIFPTRVWVLAKCSDGFEGSSGLFLETPGQEIPINRDGRFEYDLPQIVDSNGNARLAGRVQREKMTGFYLEWDYEGGVLCGTGRPGKRALRFVAR